MRRKTWTAAAAVGLMGLTACGGGQSAGPQQADLGEFTGEYDGPPVTLSYWNGFTGGDGPFMEQMVEQFMEENENITIESNTIQWADFYQRLPAAVQANQGPDVGVMQLDQIATHAARSIIVPLDSVAEGIGLSEADFSPEVWDAGIYEDERYGIPLDVHSLAMYYNLEHFEAAGITEPPTDEASFMEALDKLQAAGYDQPFWMPTLWPAHLIYLSLTWQNGAPYSDDGAEATYDSEAGEAALSWQRSIVEQGYSPENVAIDAQYVAFKNGETSITWDGIWQINDLEANDVPYGIAPIPTIGDEEAVWANSHQFFMTRQATQDENKAQAAQVFLAWMSENSAQWAGAGMIPARASEREGDALDGMPQQVIAETIDTMRFLPSVPGLGGVQTEALEPAVANAILGEAEPADALSRATSQANELLVRNREQFGD